jgi:cell division protein FtsQ
VKRPQGFDQNPRANDGQKPGGTKNTEPRQRRGADPSSGRVTSPKERGPAATDAGEPQKRAKAPKAVSPAAQARAATRDRKRFEREEVKRFTRRSRVRRRLIVVAIAAVVSLFGVVAIAVFSPLMAVDSIEIRGAERIDKEAVLSALDGQRGVPLALIDAAAIERDLAGFALIQSYSTEAKPPHTLVVSIVEREPIGVVADGSTFAVVDPAGVVVDSVRERPNDLPEIQAGEASTGNRAFRSAVAVLLALPVELRSRVSVITASTNDDVEFALSGGTQTVRWGSVDRSEYKSRVFAALFATQKKSADIQYDVSSPDAPVVRKP